MKTLFALVILSFTTTSIAHAQWKGDSVEATKAEASAEQAKPEGFFSFNSTLSVGLGTFQIGDVEASPGFAYEGGVSLRYTYGTMGFDLGVLGSNRTVSLENEGIRSLSFSYFSVVPRVITTVGWLSSAVGLGIGLPVGASHNSTGQRQDIPLGSINTLYELRGQVMFSLGDSFPFKLFVMGTIPLNNTGEIDLGHRTLTGRSGTIQFGIAK